MENSMKTAVYYGPRDIRMERAPVPEPAEGEALLRVLRSGICGTDAGEWVAGPKVFPVLHQHPNSGHVGPMIPGHEFVGEIVAVNGDDSFEPGEVVVSGAGVSCGQCDRCREGRTNLCRQYKTLGLNMNGGMAEYVAVPTRTLAVVPQGVSADHAALAQPLAVGIHAARRSQAKSGDNVVIIGAGAIGSFVLAGLLHLEPVNVAVIDFPGPKLDRARKLGAQYCLEPHDGLAQQVIEIFGGKPDVVIEASGAPGQLAFSLGLVRDGGRVLGVGIPKKAVEIDMHSMVFREISLDTTLAHVFKDDIPAALEILAEGVLGEELAEDPVPLSQLGEALDRLASGSVEGKVLIDPFL